MPFGAIGSVAVLVLLGVAVPLMHALFRRDSIAKLAAFLSIGITPGIVSGLALFVCRLQVLSGIALSGEPAPGSTPWSEVEAELRKSLCRSGRWRYRDTGPRLLHPAARSWNACQVGGSCALTSSGLRSLGSLALRSGAGYLQRQAAQSLSLQRQAPLDRSIMSGHRIFSMAFASVYPAYLNKAERKGRTKEEVNRVICWLTGYNEADLHRQIELKTDFESLFAQAPAMNPNRSKITGVVCGVRVEDVENPLMQMIRQLDKLVDELAKGKSIEKILRQ